MANTYTSLHYHIVFSTKARRRCLNANVEERVWKYLGGIAKENRLVPIKIGGVEDHIHVLVGAPATISVSKIAQILKGGSSKWIRQSIPEIRNFAWQDGYGGFTVSKSHVDDVAAYIANQREHHRTKSFQEEFRALLQRHGIEYDERYIWG